MKTARIIYNPTSGKEQFKQSLAKVLQKFEEAGFITSTHATTAPNDATKASVAACEMGIELLIVAGGDGTVSEVINGLAQCESRPTLGVIPVGTVNDYAKALHISDDIFEAIDTIINGVTVEVDIGKMNDKYFMNIAGGGKITEVSYEAPSRLKAIIGPLAYYVKGIEFLPQITSSEVKIEYDGEVFQGKIMLFLIGLTNSIGGFDKLVEDPVFDNGYFSLFIVRDASLVELAHLMTLVSRGEHYDHPKLQIIRAKNISVESTNDSMQLNLDGEYGGKLPAKFENLQAFLSIRVPEAVKNAHFKRTIQS
ncbi:diacylglycerol kinase [Aliicoccus persicus]|uniref:Diacylglycerol kinase n=1 Tax=Aliicoccus persicus TaxID=930138 RepID=A0A662Z4P5_9STAP|nr:diacylglycerol kinase [Aliicoccus persicus]SEW11727.1 diacylglycerol kinase [Aliicoccus persicus]